RDSRRRLPPGIYGVRRLRCLSRRRLRMLRPPFVRMRARKPCVRARLRFFGWYVRFMRSRSLASAFCFPAICEVAAEWRFVRGDAVREQLYARPRRGQPDGLAPAPARSSPHQAVPPGPLARVELVSKDGTAPADAEPTRRDDPSPARNVGLNPKYTFEQFVICDGNRFAHAAALAVAEMPGQAYNPLFLHGPPGLGKTHLLHAIGNYVARYADGLTVRYATLETFTSEFVDAV